MGPWSASPTCSASASVTPLARGLTIRSPLTRPMLVRAAGRPRGVAADPVEEDREESIRERVRVGARPEPGVRPVRGREDEEDGRVDVEVGPERPALGRLPQEVVPARLVAAALPPEDRPLR